MSASTDSVLFDLTDGAKIRSHPLLPQFSQDKKQKVDT